MESAQYFSDLAMLDWQVDLGATEAICDAPVNRYDLPDRLPTAKKADAAKAIAPGLAPKPAEVDVVAVAQAAVGKAETLEDLHAALAGFEHCELKRGAKNMVFSDGAPGARVMIVGEAPGRDEDREGRPFVGAVGQLLDKMLGAIDMSRSSEGGAGAVYLTNALPWRPPQDRDPKPEEIDMMRPFLLRHITLAKPEVLVVMGNLACQALLGKRGVSRLRGTFTQAADLPTLPMYHPAYLMRNPAFKREAWADLLTLKSYLKGIQK